MELTVFTVFNRGYMPGAMVMLFTLVENLEKSIVPDLWLFVEPEIERDVSKIAAECIQHLARPFRLTVRVLDASVFDQLPRDWGGSHFAYGRLLAAQTIERDRALYVDGDVLFNLDGSKLLGEATLGKAITAVLDVKVRRLGDESTLFRTLGLNPNAPYFNSGLMWVDLTLWRDIALGHKAVDIALRHPQEMKWWDQSALNAVLEGDWHQLAPAWNKPVDTLLGRFELFPKSQCKGSNLHYLGPEKPWLTWNPYGLYFERAYRRLPKAAQRALGGYRFGCVDRIRANWYFLVRAIWNYGSWLKRCVRELVRRP